MSSASTPRRSSSSGESLLAIINDILDFSKIEAGKMDLEESPFDVRGCIESAVELIGPAAAKKGIEVAYWIEPGRPRWRSGTSAACARSC